MSQQPPSDKQSPQQEPPPGGIDQVMGMLRYQYNEGMMRAYDKIMEVPLKIIKELSEQVDTLTQEVETLRLAKGKSKTAISKTKLPRKGKQAPAGTSTQ